MSKINNFIMDDDNMEMNNNNIIESSYVELNNIMDNWCNIYEENFSGGKMRGDRGDDIENFVKNIIHKMSDVYKVNVYAVKGNNDKKELVLHHNNKTIKKDHQVDIHCLLYTSDAADE